MKCKICKNIIENLNLTIFHDCKNTFPFIFDINEEIKNYCYNPFKNIHINKFFNQIEFDKKNNDLFSMPSISRLEYEAISIIESLLLNFFNYQFNNQTDKFLFHNSSFDEEIAERLEKIIQNLHNSNLEEKIERAIKVFILDVYYLILAKKYFRENKSFHYRDKSFHDEDKSFQEVFTKKTKTTEKYKEEIIDYFQKYFKEKEIIRSNLDKFIYIPNNATIIDNLEQKYLLMKCNNIPSNKDNYNNVILYSIEKNKVLSSCFATKIIKININNYIGLDKKNNLISIELKIEPDKNIFNLEASYCFKYLDIKEIIDFYIIDDYRLICIDKLNNIHLLLKKNYDYFIYKTIDPKISLIKNEQILIDKDNGQFAILYIKMNNVFSNFIGAILFYDLELNLKKNILLEDLYDSYKNFLSDSKESNFPTIKKFNKDLYIIFWKRIYLISVKYLEIINIINNMKYELNCKYFIFSNSEEIFIKYRKKYERYLYRYKLIKNELTLFKKYIFEDKLNDMEEIDNKGNYSILYQDYNLWQEYYIKNYKDENYLYPIFKEIKIKPISRRGREIEKDVKRSKYTGGKNPKNKVRYFEKNYDNFYFEIALNPVKKKRRQPKMQEEEDKKEGEELKREDIDISLEGYLKTKEKPREEDEKEIKRIEDDKLLTKVEKEEENISSTNDPGKKKGKKKKKNFKEVDDFEILGVGEKEKKRREKRREKRQTKPKFFFYNEEDFPNL